MAVHESKNGAGGQQHGRTPQDGPGGAEQQQTTQQRDRVQQLEAAITAALRQRSKAEPLIVSRMQERTELYRKAAIQAKQAAIDTVAIDAPPAERPARQDDMLRRPDGEVLPSGITARLAAVDARQYGTLRDPDHCAAAALALAGTARLSAGYRAALARTSAEVSAVVEAAIAAGEVPQPGKPVTPGGEPAAPHGQAATTPAMPPEAQTPVRTADSSTVAEQPGLNSIAEVTGQRRQPRRTQSREPEAEQPKELSKPAHGDNRVSADEVFTAEKNDTRPVVPARVADRYLRVGTRFYDPEYTDVVAFEDRGNRLETRSDSGQIVRAMVAIAQARGWDGIRVAGSGTFRREVWLEAAALGMHVKGYTPGAVDRAGLARRTGHAGGNPASPDDSAQGREQRPDATQSEVRPVPAGRSRNAGQTSHAGDPQPGPEDRQRARAFVQKAPVDAVADYPELAGAFAAMASIDRKVMADGLTPRQRAVVMTRVEANLVNSIERGQLPELKVRDIQEPVEARRDPARDRTR